MDQIDNSNFFKISKEEHYEYKQLSNFFNISEDLMCIAGFDGYFKKINPAVTKLLGYTEEELLARPINDFIYGEDKMITIDSRKTVYSGKVLKNFENRYLTKSGDIVWLSWTSIPSLDSELVFAIAKDISLKKLEEEKRVRLLESMRKINKDLQNFTQMTSHDMRSPINNIIAISKLLDDEKIENPKTAELVDILKSTSIKLHYTINNFVDVMIKNDQVAVKIEDLKLSDTLQIVEKSIGVLINKANAKIISNFSAYDHISYNKLYLESIFQNLLSNSIKYANPNKSPIIKITSIITEGVYQITFTDNGLGFNMENVKDKVFGLYQVFHHHPDSKGLGLYLIHHNITALGGNITLESNVNEGSTFTISFKKA